MAIRMSCPNCQASLEMPDALAGKRARCSRCQGIFTAPAAEADVEIVDVLPMELDAEPSETAPHWGIQSSPASAPLPPPPPPPPAAAPPISMRPPRSVAAPDTSTGAVLTWISVGVVCFLVLAGVMGGFAYYMLATRENAHRAAEKAMADAERARADAERVRFPQDVKKDEQPPPIPIPIPPFQPFQPPPIVQAKAEVIALEMTTSELLTQRRLEPTDGFEQGRRCKCFEIKLKAGRKYIIDMMSGQMDSYLHLLDNNGRQLAADDDRGGNLNARIEFKCEQTATYRICTSDLRSRFGDFTLRLRDDTAEPLTLQGGEIVKQGSIAADDVYDAQQGWQRKLYHIQLLSRQRFTFELESKAFDAYLRVEDEAGTMLAQDDNSGGGTNARLEFNPTRFGRYRIVVTSKKGGAGEFVLTVREQKAPNPFAFVPPQPPPPAVVVAPKLSAPNVSIVAKERVQEKEIAYTELTAESARSFDWAPDGSAFYLMSQTGTLSRISLPKFIEEKRLEFNKNLALSFSSQGLLASSASERVIHVLDPKSLQIKKTIEFPAPAASSPPMSAPSLDFAVLVAGPPAGGFNQQTSGQVRLIDLKTGNELAKFKSPYRLPKLTSDGKTFVVNDGAIKTFSVEGNIFVPNPGQLSALSSALSADGKYIWSGSSTSETKFYEVRDLSRAAFSLKWDRPVRSVTLDPQLKLAYALDLTRRFTVVTIDGNKVGDYNLPLTGSPLSQQARVHPQGGKLLIFGINRILYVETDGLKAAP